MNTRVWDSQVRIQAVARIVEKRDEAMLAFIMGFDWRLEYRAQADEMIPRTLSSSKATFHAVNAVSQETSQASPFQGTLHRLQKA